ncbi:MAG: hypothetical protein AB1778_09265 [Candidatus Bipolaricaulota bacterium]
MNRRALIAAVALMAAGLAGSAPADPELRDGFFGISGIIPDFSYLDGLGAECATSGFWIGPSATFLGSNKEELHTRQMREFVTRGVTPIATFYLGSVDASATEAAATIVAHYTTGSGAADVGAPIRYWEIGDEQNGVWATSCSPEEYARRVAIVAAGVRAACPSCVTVLGGLLDGPEMGDWALIPYLERFLAAGGGEWIDVYAFHLFGLARPSPFQPGGPLYDEAATIVDGMRRVLAGYGREDAPLWVTEMSTFSGGMGPIEQSETEQAADLVKRFVLLRFLGVDKALWTYVTEPQFEGTGIGFFDQAGLVYDGIGPYDRGADVKKLAYGAFARMTDRLGGGTWIDGARENGVTWVAFDVRGETVTVLWQDPWIREGPLWITPAASVTVETMLGEPRLSSAQTFRLDLDLEPVYVVGASIAVSVSAPALTAP